MYSYLKARNGTQQENIKTQKESEEQSGVWSFHHK